MARRVSWTNNSGAGYLGTYVYRAETLDPQNLPAPVATVDPVAQGETAEWIDNTELEPGDYDYAVQDFDGQGVGTLSETFTYNIPLDVPAIGSEWQGGIYAGTITYADGRQFHLICAAASGESDRGPQWGQYGTTTNINDPDDGVYNQETILANYDNGSLAAFYYCRDYTGGGYADWYMPALNEFITVTTNLSGHSALTSAPNPSYYRWVSYETSWSHARGLRLTDGAGSNDRKDSAGRYVRPIRRIPV